MRLALTIEYEGTRYHGFQYQVNAPSIQGEIERAIQRLTGERVRITGAGRTDAGVHAAAQVVAFDTDSAHSTDTFVSALNHYLPADIAIRAAHIVAQDFDPRRHARSRTYRYSILNSRTPSPLTRQFACHIREALDVAQMRSAAALFIGEHDFRRFAAPLPTGKTNSVRAIFDTSVEHISDTIALWVTGNAFLQRQVRRMAGSLVDIGRGRLSKDELQVMIDDGATNRIAHSLPAHGLCLVRVEYANYPPSVADAGSDRHNG
jgi:tRNA pseudouridine38-40 synthase